MFCEQCGSEVKEDIRFCEKCGNPIYSVAGNNYENMQMGKSTQPVYYENQQPVIIQQQKKSSKWFHFFVGSSIVVFGVVIVCLGLLIVKTIEKGQMNNEASQVQQNVGATNDGNQQAAQMFSAAYSYYCGVYEIKKIRSQAGVWENYSTVNEVVGFLIDFRNLYKYGSQTNMYSAPTISLNLDSIDLTAIGYGMHNINEFTYEKINGMDFFIDEVHGFAIFSDGTYLYIGYQNGNGAWQGECAFK